MLEQTLPEGDMEDTCPATPFQEGSLANDSLGKAKCFTCSDVFTKSKASRSSKCKPRMVKVVQRNLILHTTFWPRKWLPLEVVQFVWSGAVKSVRVKATNCFQGLQ